VERLSLRVSVSDGKIPMSSSGYEGGKLRGGGITLVGEKEGECDGVGGGGW